MTIPELLLLMQQGSLETCKTTLEAHCIVKNICDAVKQYHPELHDVKNQGKRPDKVAETQNGTKIIKVARIPLAIQKKIVRTASAFVGTPEMHASPDNVQETTLFNGMRRTWDRNKLDYSFGEIKTRTMAELHSAELWQPRIAEEGYWDRTGVKTNSTVLGKIAAAITGQSISSKYKLTMQILARSKGDSLYPVFDQFGDMIAFGRGYKTISDKAENVDHFDIYTATDIYYAKQVGSDVLWASVDNGAMLYSTGFKSIKNVIGKIPIIYYHQQLVEWSDVQDLIERLEVIASNHADTNDYSGSPIVLAKGQITGWADKGESGKLLQCENNADVSYLTFDGAPESIKMEIQNLQEWIYSLTNTPNLSFDNMKQLGQFSGVALKTLFIDAHLKAAEKEQIFGEGVQRRINYLKSAMCWIDTTLKPAQSLEIKPIFKYYLPENISEDIDNINKAVTGGFLSKETAVKLNPLVEDKEGEVERVKAEQNITPVDGNI